MEPEPAGSTAESLQRNEWLIDSDGTSAAANNEEIVWRHRRRQNIP